MEDRLILGIPDSSENDAPKNRFATTDLRSRSRSLVLLPLFSTFWVAILSQFFTNDEDMAASDHRSPSPENQHPAEKDITTSSVPGGTGEGSHSAAFPHSKGGPAQISAADSGTINNAADAGDRVSHLYSPKYAAIANDNHHLPAYVPPVEFALLRPLNGYSQPSGANGTAGGRPASNEANASPRGEGSKQDQPPTTPKEEEPVMPPAKQLNRRPMVSRPVYMSDGLINQSIIVTMGELLVGATDADGDELSVQALTVESGSLKSLGFNMWLYTPTEDQLGSVAFHYVISDGQNSVMQSAFLDLVKPTGLQIEGTDGDDVLVGTPLDDFIDAKGGDDIVYGRESDDINYGGEGNDRLIGGDGNDIIFGGNGNDVLSGGNGNDTLFGEAGNDILYGDDGNDILFGGSGDDLLYGGNGDDRLVGDTGNDSLYGGDGADHLEGGDGNDIVQGDSGNDILDGGAGNDTMDGGDGDDLLFGGDGDDTLLGGDGNDTIDGGAGVNQIDAGAGDDIIRISSFSALSTIHGGEGNDILDISDAAEDAMVDLVDGWAEVGGVECAKIFEIESVRGGSGNDRLVANDHVNIMIGGAGNDIFVFRNLEALQNDGSVYDRISDFNVGDRIDFSRLESSIENFAEQKLFFSGLASATPSEIGELRFEHRFLADDEEVTVITGHLGDDESHDFGLILDGNHDLTANDFILAARAIEAHS